MPLGRDERAELDAFKGDVVHEVKVTTDAAIAHVEKIVAPFAPLAQDVAQLKADTARQTPIIERIARELRRSAKERKKRSILDGQKHEDAAKWKRRYATGAGLLATIAALAEIYRALKGHG